MAKITRETKFLIVGSGVAGLALAQMLRKQGLGFEVFERDQGKRPQGWAIGLDVCLPAAKPLMPEDLEPLPSLSPNHVLGIRDSFAMLDSRSGRIFGTALSKNTDGDSDGFLVSREKFRHQLMKGLNIQYGKHLTHYEEDQSGVTIFFKDGTSARGDVLIAADGSNSAIRHQLLNGFRAMPSSWLMFHGNVVLSSAQYSPILAHSTTGIVGSEVGMKSYMQLMEYNRDDTALFNWTIAYRPKDLPKEQEWSMHATGEQILDKMLEKAAHFPPYFVEAMRLTGPQGMQVPPIRLMETVLPENLDINGCVTLIGDAAHSMVPFKGMGANTAILDTCDLLHLIVDGIDQGRSIQEVLRDYEKVMIPRGRDKVLTSREVGETGTVADIAGDRFFVDV